MTDGDVFLGDSNNPEEGALSASSCLDTDCRSRTSTVVDNAGIFAFSFVLEPFFVEDAVG